MTEEQIRLHADSPSGAPASSDPECTSSRIIREQFCVDAEYAGLRIDKFLSLIYADHSRSYFQKLISGGFVLIGDAACKNSSKVREEDIITVRIPPDETPSVCAENIPLDILYEDADLLIVNKPKGMVVHPAPGHTSGTLVNAVLYHCQGELSGIGGVIRPGIVHRIDKDTTGALIVCKNDAAHRHVAEQIRVHSVTRVYRGFVSGLLKEKEGTIDLPVGRHPANRKKMAVVNGGRRAVTHYMVLETYPKHSVSLAEFRLETGRTHQIRVHMAYLGHPILGDPLYGSGKNPYHLEGQALHAMTIGLIHPSTGNYLEVSAPDPADFEKLRRILADV